MEIVKEEDSERVDHVQGLCEHDKALYAMNDDILSIVDLALPSVRTYLNFGQLAGTWQSIRWSLRLW
jgi:hypothetical protein